MLARLPRHIAERELNVIGRMLNLGGDSLKVKEVPDSHGPGNVVVIEVRAAHLTEVFTAFGQRGVRAEDVAAEAARQAQQYLAADVPVGEHLADQLLLPLALAGAERSGRRHFRCTPRRTWRSSAGFSMSTSKSSATWPAALFCA
jgi:RNA 3'-terminal phosphate cyclase (ATP)